MADDALPDNVAVIVPAEKFPEASRATMVDAVFALVALDVTVNVVLPDWLAVKEAEPDRPVPDTASVKVPLPIVGGVTQVGADVPFDCKYWPEVPAAENEVAPEPVWYGTAPAVPPAKLVAVVAEVAFVADEALPDKLAVMVPALKLPEASRATMAEAVLALVAVVAELGMVVDAVMAPVPLP